MASCKWQTIPLSLAIPRVGTSLIVCGHRKITLFNISKANSNNYETNVFEDRKTVLLGKQSEYTFVDIASGRGKHERTVYTVTSCGYLCEVKLGDILIDKAIKVDNQTFCVRYNSELLFVGCAAGVVKICDPENLTVTAAVSLSSLLGPSAMPKVGNKAHLDVCTLVVDDNEKIVTCVYADCSMHSWQIGTDGQRIVCSAIEASSGNAFTGHPSSKSNLLRSFIGCCEKSKTDCDFISKFSMTDHNRLLSHHGGRHLVNENRASYQNANAVRFTPDGKDVICGNEDGEIKVYELSTGILRRVIEAHSSHVTCIELMYDDEFQLVCSGGRDRVMFVLNARSDFSLVQVLCDHSAAITAISLVNNRGVLTLVSAAADNVILIRRAILGGTLRFTITGEIAQTCRNRSFFVTNDYIALGGKDSEIKVFKADPVFVSKPVKTINCQKLNPNSTGFKAIDIDPSGSFMAVSQANGNISVYHLQTGQPVASLPLQSDIGNIKFTDDLKYMVSSTSNGCDLVWRLPERMTDFMRTKQEKTFQLETKKEVTYETYMSCNIGKDEDCEGDEMPLYQDPSNKKLLKQSISPIEINQQGHGKNSSNHNSECTPSIDSMSMLDNYESRRFRGDKGSAVLGRRAQASDMSRGCSTCGSEVLTCSTCSNSASTTTQTSYCSAIYSDSSCSTRDGQGRSSKPLRFYCGADHKLFGQVIEESTCIKLGPFREQQNARLTTSAHLSQNAAKLQSPSFSDARVADYHEGVTATGQSGDIPTESNQQIENKPKSGSVSRVIAEQMCQGDASQGIQKDENDTSQMITMLEEINECCEKQMLADEQYLTETRQIHFPKDKSQNYDIPSEMTGESCLNESGTMGSIKERAKFYENIMKGETKSQRKVRLSSPTRQDTAAVKEAIRLRSKRRNKEIDMHDISKDIFENTEHELEGINYTPLTTPNYSNTSSNITHLVPTSDCALLDSCATEGLGKEMPKNHESINITKKETTLEEECEDSILVSNDKDLSGKDIILVANDEDSSGKDQLNEYATKDLITFGTIMSDTCGEKETIRCNNAEDTLEDTTQGHISALVDVKCEEEGIDISENASDRREEICVIKAHSQSAYQEYDEEENKRISKQFIESLGLKEEESLVTNLVGIPDSLNAGQCVIEQLKQEGFTVPEKYHNALRACMQLSNSQETFSTLPLDTNDLELMAFLSHALKRKMVAAGLIGLSYNEIEKLLKYEEPAPNSVKDITGGDINSSVIDWAVEDNSNTAITSCGKEKEFSLDTQIKLPNNTEQLGEDDLSAIEEVNNMSMNDTDVSATLCSNADSKKCKTTNIEYEKVDSVMDTFSRFREKLQTNKSDNKCCSTYEIMDGSSNEMKGAEVLRKRTPSLLTDKSRHMSLIHTDTYLRTESSDESQCAQRSSTILQNEASLIEILPASSDTSSCSPTQPQNQQQKEIRVWNSTEKDPMSVPAQASNRAVNCMASGASAGSYLSIRTSGSAMSSKYVGPCVSASSEVNGTGRAMSRPNSCIQTWSSSHSTTTTQESYLSCVSKDTSLHQASESDSGVEAESIHRENPMVDMLRDQDEYLRKLKEVRENFERSIQALSEERKLRQAADERGKAASGKL